MYTDALLELESSASIVNADTPGDVLFTKSIPLSVASRKLGVGKRIPFLFTPLTALTGGGNIYVELIEASNAAMDADVVVIVKSAVKAAAAIDDTPFTIELPELHKYAATSLFLGGRVNFTVKPTAGAGNEFTYTCGAVIDAQSAHI